MKTDAKESATATGPGPAPNGPRAAARRTVGGRIMAGLGGFLVFFFGLLLVGAGYSEGPAKIGEGIPGAITIERCDTEADDTVCLGTFRSEDGEHRYLVEDFEPGAEHDSGDEVGAIAQSSTWFEPAAPVLWATAAKFWCVAASMFGIALLPLSNAFRRTGRTMSRYTVISVAVLLFGGLLGCGICVITVDVLA